MKLLKLVLVFVLLLFAGFLFLVAPILGVIGLAFTVALGIALYSGSRDVVVSAFLLFFNFLLFVFAPVFGILAFVVIGPGVIKLLTGRDSEPGI